MPLTVFDIKGIPATCRERIEAAVECGGKHLAAPYEAWIAADPVRGPCGGCPRRHGYAPNAQSGLATI